MRVAKQLCPICHNLIKTTHSVKYKEARIRRYRCDKCNIMVRTVQRPNEEEQVKDFWNIRPYVKIEEVLS